MRSRITLAAALLITVTLCCTAHAALNSVGAFTGTLSETWESFPHYNIGGFHFLENPTSIMGGAATISSPEMVVYQPGPAGFGLSYFGAAGVSDGYKAMGLDEAAQTCTINFDCPITSFGAFWATSATLPVVSVNFYGIDGTSIGSDQIYYSGYGQLQWRGWSSDIGISAVSYSGSFVVIDGLQANGACRTDVPELPASVLAAIPGVIGLAWRRRK